MTDEKNKDITPLMEVRNINKAFPGVQALDDVSVAFYPGEVHAVVGENGAGKSTLMKVMAGAYRPDSGTLLFQGKEVSFNHPVEAQNMGISIIYQEFNLLPERTVAQNISPASSNISASFKIETAFPNPSSGDIMASSCSIETT